MTQGPLTALAPPADTPAGRTDIEPANVIAFPEGLPGFGRCRRFVLLSADPSVPLQYLQGLDPPAPAFVTIDPRLVLPSYRCLLSDDDVLRLDASEDDVLLWLAFVSLGDEGAATVNLRAPVVVNPRRMMGFQVMPRNTLYPLRHPLRLE